MATLHTNDSSCDKRKGSAVQRLADAIRRSLLAEKRAMQEAIELREERERTGYRVELQWEEPDLANASAPQREAAWVLLRGRPARYRGPWMKRSVSGLSLVDAEKQGRR
ncbi:MAG TPA: hypothetical protein PK472_11700, partial [Pseudomonadota bacterium]|nr:hypothetical protein [Pseudomonadota bacterium]